MHLFYPRMNEFRKKYWLSRNNVIVQQFKV